MDVHGCAACIYKKSGRMPDFLYRKAALYARLRHAKQRLEHTTHSAASCSFQVICLEREIYMLFMTFSSTSEIFGLRTDTSAAWW